MTLSAQLVAIGFVVMFGFGATFLLADAVDPGVRVGWWRWGVVIVSLMMTISALLWLMGFNHV